MRESDDLFLKHHQTNYEEIWRKLWVKWRFSKGFSIVAKVLKNY